MSTKDTTKTKKQGLKIEVTQPADFEPVADISVTTTELLSKLVNQILRPTFTGDYKGCHITATPVNGQGLVLETRLYFKILTDAEYSNKDLIFAFQPTSVAAKTNSDEIVSKLERISLLSDRNLRNSMTITEDGKSALSEFIIPQAKNSDGSVRWNECMNVTVSGNNSFVCVFRVDINKIVGKIFGEKGSDGTPLYYTLQPTYQIGGSSIFGNQNSDIWTLNVIRIHHGGLSMASKIMGIPVPSEYGMPQMVVAE